MEDATPSTMRRDIVSAYVAIGAKVAAWAIVSAVVFTRGGDEQFALLTLVRSTLGLLAFVVLGIGPAMVRLVSEASEVTTVAPSERSYPEPKTRVLSYASPRPRSVLNEDPATTVYVNGLLLVAICAAVGVYLVDWYGEHYGTFYRTSGYVDARYAAGFIFALGFGLMMRLISDACGALLQVRGYIWLDNLLLAGAELSWPIFTWMAFDPSVSSQTANNAAGAFAVSGVLLLLLRSFAAGVANGLFVWRPAPIRVSIMWALLSYGALVTAAQLADFLYAPTDFILINRLLTAVDASNYAPAVQIDSALLLLVGAIATVLLPKTAVAHARNQISLIRQYYLRATLISTLILSAAAISVWMMSPLIFRLWLDNPMYATRAILPLLLIHTVVGGSSAVGRSILLGMGKVKPFTISVLIAGVSNVILSYIFVRYFDLGLRGIVFGTIIAVVGRCAIWMPWYVIRTLRAEARRSGPALARSGPA
ncbi:hypothetical protein BH09PLA1_BH09PLA1_35580 [soil metagenome]